MFQLLLDGGERGPRPVPLAAGPLGEIPPFGDGVGVLQQPLGRQIRDDEGLQPVVRRQYDDTRLPEERAPRTAETCAA